LDKLSVCKVNDGTGGRTIVCGAQNHKPGDKVPLILPNFALPLKPGDKDPFVIKERKVFGITSQGMLCSPQELGLPDQVDGLLILPADAPVGKPFGEYLGRTGGDVVYDLEVTPEQRHRHRPRNRGGDGKCAQNSRNQTRFQRRKND
jgi:phenylalanyl-tRNA synthetase beta chain